MNASTALPFFHEASGAVRFWVLVKDLPVGASIARETLHYRYQPDRSDDDPLATYHQHAEALAEAVRRRVAGGSIEPVMLRERDLADLPPGA